MKQLTQDTATGKVSIGDVSPPHAGPGSLLVAASYSLLSTGGAGQSRARAGLAGVVLRGCDDAPAAPGDLVACGAAGDAAHAEVVAVSRNLCARVPSGVSPEAAAYTSVASVALHGVRRAEVAARDVTAVIGLGLVGQLALELLAAEGGAVVGLDPDGRRVQLARESGFLATSDEAAFASEVDRLTGGRGADGTLITAAIDGEATLTTAAAVTRERSVVCLVGGLRIDSPRGPVLAKDLRVEVSPAEDPFADERGIGHPAAHERWPERRNLAEVLRLMATRRLRPSRLTTHTFDLEDGVRAYELLGDEAQPSLGIMVRYPGLVRARAQMTSANGDEPGRRPPVRPGVPRSASSRTRVAVVGAGSFARGTLMPVVARTADIVAVANATGDSARAAAARFGAPRATTEPEEVIENPEVDAVVIATPHDTHARYVVHALRRGKHVFVESPLALNDDQLEDVKRAAAGSPAVLMVGFNRRFAPLASRLVGTIGRPGPLVSTYRVGAARLPRTHSADDPRVGGTPEGTGGRMVGEVCQFIDLLSLLGEGLPTAVSAAAVGADAGEDNFTATLRYANGSAGVVIYTTLGDPSPARERIEVVGPAGAAVLDDFHTLTLRRDGDEERIELPRDRGHAEEIATFLRACSTGQQPWPIEDMVGVTRATFEIRRELERPAAR